MLILEQKIADELAGGALLLLLPLPLPLHNLSESSLAMVSDINLKFCLLKGAIVLVRVKGVRQSSILG